MDSVDYLKILQYRNTHNPYAKQLGIVVEEIGPGTARVSKTITERDLNPGAITHGGVYFSMADTACASASASHGHMAVTLGASYEFFRSAHTGDRLTAVATEVKHGRTVSVYEVQIFDQNQTLLGKGSFTFYSLGTPIEF